MIANDQDRTPPGDPPGDTASDDDATVEHGSLALPAGTRRGGIELLRVLGDGGFGIVYAARDINLDRRVAVKEYLPSTLATRTPNADVVVAAQSARPHFEAGLRSFLNEARLLARFDHPSLVKVLQYWESNGTAYMVMPLHAARTLRQRLRAGPPPDEAWLRTLLWPLLEVLEMMHAEDCLHRDIAPDNILVIDEVKPLLLDFGAARRVVAGLTQSLTVILKPGYAPIEQYAESGTMRQGPWSDVYALCAVMYLAIAGRAPATSVSRAVHDDLVPLSTLGAGRFSPGFLAALDAGLAVRPETRPPSARALRDRLFGNRPPPTQRSFKVTFRGIEPAPEPPPDDGGT
jgi:hypothetical protein